MRKLSLEILHSSVCEVNQVVLVSASPSLFLKWRRKFKWGMFSHSSSCPPILKVPKQVCLFQWNVVTEAEIIMSHWIFQSFFQGNEATKRGWKQKESSQSSTEYCLVYCLCPATARFSFWGEENFFLQSPWVPQPPEYVEFSSEAWAFKKAPHAEHAQPLGFPFPKSSETWACLQESLVLFQNKMDYAATP